MVMCCQSISDCSIMNMSIGIELISLRTKSVIRYTLIMLTNNYDKYLLVVDPHYHWRTEVRVDGCHNFFQSHFIDMN